MPSRFRSPILLSAFAVGCCALLTPLSAQELTEKEKKTILEEIEKIEAKLNDSKATNNANALRKFRAAAASPQAALEYYMSCKKKLDYTDKGKKESEWREWRDSQSEFKDSGFAKARQYQLRFLVLTVQAGMLDEDDDTGKAKLISQTADFMTAMVANYKEMATHNDVLSGSVMSSTFAETTRVRDTLDLPSTWAGAPLDIDGVYDSLILPYYREKGNSSRLQTVWQSRIKQLTAVLGTAEPVKISTRSNRTGSSSTSRSRTTFGSNDREKAREQRREKQNDAEVRLAEFKEDRLPNLEWEMHRDAFLFGKNKSPAIRKLGSHIRSNLANTNASGWISELKTLATGDYDIEDYIGLDKESEDAED